MWISKMGAARVGGRTETAQAGLVTIGGESPGVVTDGERRSLFVMGPGGYRWTPKAGSQVMVIKTGEGEHVVMGALDGEEPEEIRLSAGGAEICLSSAGITVTGDLAVTGSLSVSGVLTVGGRVI